MPRLVKLVGGNEARAIVPNGGVVKIGLPAGPVGPPGEPGPPGSGSLPNLFAPEDYGAAANGTTNDATAIQAALTAAAAVGGRVRLSGTYGWSGTITVPDGVGVEGLASNKAGAASKLKALGATSKLRLGDFSTGTGRLGRIADIEIDGNSTGDPTGIVVIEAVLTHFENLRIHDSAGVGVLVNGAQNCTFESCAIITHGTDCLVIDKGAGGLAFYRCSVSGGASRSLVVTQSAASGGGAYPFSPAHVVFDHCIFENNINCTALVDIEAGNLIRFRDCGVSINNASTVSGGYLVRIKNNPTYSTVATHAEFDSCQMFGGTSSQASGFHVQGLNFITVAGHGFAQNMPALYSWDGLSTAEMFGVFATTGVTSRFNMLSGGAPNGWTSPSRAPFQIKGDAVVGAMGVLVGRDTDNGHRLAINRDGGFSWGDGSTYLPTGVDKPSLGYDSTTGQLKARHVTLTGSKAVEAGPTSTINTAGQTVTMDCTNYSYFGILFNAVGASVTTLNLDNPVDGQEITIALTQTAGGGTVTWPASVKLLTGGSTFDTTGLSTTFVHLRYRASDSKWFEYQARVVVDGTVSSAVDAEYIRDVIGAALVQGSGVTITVNDAGDTITVAATGVQPSRTLNTGTGLTGGGDLSADRTIAIDTTAEAERIRDVIGAALVQGSGVTITVDDAGDTITIAATASPTVATNVQTASYTLVTGDAGKCVEMNVAGANTLTVPTNATAAFPVGTVLQVRQVGAGQTTIAPGAGVTLRYASSLTTRAQWSTLTLHKRGTDEWVVGGDAT